MVVAMIAGSCSKSTDPPPPPPPEKPVLTWERTYDGLQGQPYAIIESENGYLFTGSYPWNQPGDFLFAEIDTAGELLWYQTHGNYEHQEAMDVVRTPNGYLAVGISGFDYPDSYRLMMVAVDNAGNKLWEKNSHYGYCWLEGRAVTTCDDGGYVVVGSAATLADSIFGFCGGFNAFVMKVDENGDSVWALNVDWGGDDNARSVCQTPDGGFAVSGDNSSGLCFMRISADGELIGEVKRHGGESGYKMANHMIVIPDGFMIAGVCLGDPHDVVLWKLSPDGSLIWKQTYGGTDRDFGYSIAFDGDSYIVAGWTLNFGAGRSDVYLFRTDLSGNQLWWRTYGGERVEMGESVLTTSDGGIVVLAFTESFGAGRHYYVLRTDSEGEIHPEDSLQ
jgi:hypothetical protein